MTDTPDNPVNFDVELIPVEQVKLDYSLLVDRGQGPEVFEVGNVRFRAIEDADGNHVGTYLLAAEQGRGADPWELEYPVGTQVSRILGPSRS